MKAVAIVLAAGSGKRMRSEVAKQYMLLRGKPVLYYALKAFEDSAVDEVVLVTASRQLQYCREEIVDHYGFQKVKQIVEGGRERYHSVYAGLCAVPDCDYVLVHDGARPFVSAGMIESILRQMDKEQAVVVGMPSKDTVKLADADGYVNETPNRKNVWMIQTPQAFHYPLLKKAYERLFEAGEKFLAQKGIQVTDDAMVLEQFLGDVRIRLTEGSYENIKITTPEDLFMAERILGNL